MTDMGGRPLGSRYHIGAMIGRGGMGEVWRGTDETGAAVAIKTLQPQFAADPGVVQRFVAERHLLTSARDPHVVRVRDLVAEGSTLAIVMDLVEGTDLRADLSRRGTLASAEACRLGAQIARGLAAIHAARIVHRDVKPENVLLDQTIDPPRALLTDFGVSKLLEESPDRLRATVVAGTPLYLAPELALGAPPDPRADIYSLGIVLYELLCGLTPFTGMAPGAILHAQTTLDPGRPQGLDDRLWNLLAQLLNKDPAQRPGDAAAVARQLEQLGHDLDGRVALEPLSVPPPPVPAGPYRVSPDSPVVAATHMATPQQVWQPSPVPTWDTPTTLGAAAGQAWQATPQVPSMPGQPGLPILADQQGFNGPSATPGPVGYVSMPPQVMAMSTGYPVGPPPVERKRMWLVPVILSIVAVLVAGVTVWMIGARGQSIVAAPVASTGSPEATPSRTTTPAPATSSIPSAATPAEGNADTAGSLPTSVGPYSDSFVHAWGIGDSQAASRYATDAALTTLFQYDGRGGSSWAYKSSTALGSRTQVRYADGSGRSLYVVLDRATVARGAAHAVVGANVEVDSDGQFVTNWPLYPGPISLGDRGDRVLQWQSILIQAGIISDRPENRDGLYGNATKAAVDRYLSGRNATNYDGDGILGRNTYDLITR